MRVTRHPLEPSILILPPPSVAPTMNQAMKIPTSAPKGTLIRARPEQATQIRTVAKIACLGKSANGERIQHLDFVKLRLEPNWCVIYYCEINRFEWNWPRNFCTGLRLCRWGHQHYSSTPLSQRYSGFGAIYEKCKQFQVLCDRDPLSCTHLVFWYEIISLLY